ncbi:gliding motility-associated C-terminal domain-containing protein [Lewinella sp. IMCC34183]|uniref:gliding motility-associated C-terminal domain-containing protein n=1 Tax=Lewinella sp. IMCC34183 TaxID=2248762 RepID=UPI00130043EF|nr:gliding motility-associated C-terminal domain-containing protein [Lewinella sp. IMCC34183]
MRFLPATPCLRALCCLLLLFFSGTIAVGQQCTGNLGENIFTEGDFGSGAANILTPDPRIAPGFQYVTTPPPNDGFYTITNNTGRWATIYDTWRLFGDNSSDPNGYMMLVNASYAPGLFYEQRVDGLCENTLYQFSADVINVVKPNANQLLPNVSFLLDNTEYINTGFIPEDGTWKTFGFTFTTQPGQTSVTLALRNNAPGGLGNDIALDNISFRACGPQALILPEIAANICEDGAPITLTATINGDQYPTPAVQWQRSDDGGNTWADLPGETGRSYVHAALAAGTYTYRYLLANSPGNVANSKCRIVSNPKVVNVIPKEVILIDTICAGLTYTIGDSDYTRSGSYVDSLVSSLGCDSIVRLELEVVADPGLAGAFTVRDPSCSYLTDGSVVLDSVAGGRAPYDFRFGNAEQAIGSPITPLGEGVYFYRITDRYGCAQADTLRLQSPFPFTIDLGPDQVITLGDATTLSVRASAPVASYDWLPAGSVACDSACTTVDLLLPRSTTVRVLATSEAGCAAADSVRIDVLTDRLVYIPSAFSPNGDGTNDRFLVYGSEPNVQGIASLRIYDRWGGEVFTATDLAANASESGWDGTRGGRAVPAGTYVYVAEVVFLDGVRQRYSGSLTLLH